MAASMPVAGEHQWGRGMGELPHGGLGDQRDISRCEEHAAIGFGNSRKAETNRIKHLRAGKIGVLHASYLSYGAAYPRQILVTISRHKDHSGYTGREERLQEMHDRRLSVYWQERLESAHARGQASCRDHSTDLHRKAPFGGGSTLQKCGAIGIGRRDCVRDRVGRDRERHIVDALTRLGGDCGNLPDGLWDLFGDRKLG